MTALELDVRPLRKPDKHPTIFRTYDALAVGESFVLVNNHDPKHLRDEFDSDLPGGYGWEYVERGPVWRIRISKLAATPLPRIVGDLHRGTQDPDAAGIEWKLEMRRRDLDSNVVRLAPDAGIGDHTGPDLDVLLVVLDGSGLLATERGDLTLEAGALVWLPRRSRRRFQAGPDGLRYLTVHGKRQALVLDAAPPKVTT
ncbi:Protein of unknown function DUF2249 [Pseudonocardia dioxanivorans CB1190]|uniref:DUF2249 domain-containing protein n=1 Tax=Pseudonocardia dioxanivorans (strain ATCC 55486 / DSM 44775 / JCM 13855 / CB1190) TaxID=675635 RepID=F4D0I2_PSEUX|nr:DUF2249 domain-containing protein [Pseudonocardia dioxanivorans]AEA26778.1 Protein of unknown function DUF2249 [Pseudonocardia dioxanivorans CB1190]GJF04817.1 hypothetical protein PSD17_37700 [Pseudonocardia sp. D17]